MPEDCGVHLDEAEGELRRVWLGVPEIAEDEDPSGEAE